MENNAKPKGWRAKRAAPSGRLLRCRFVVFDLAVETMNKNIMEISFLFRSGPTCGPELTTDFGWCWPLIKTTLFHPFLNQQTIMAVSILYPLLKKQKGAVPGSPKQRSI